MGTELLEEDDLVVYYLKSKENNEILVEQFDEFCSEIVYDDETLLNFMIYDDNQASFLGILVKIFKKRRMEEDFGKKFESLEVCLGELVETLENCSESIPYNTNYLVR